MKILLIVDDYIPKSIKVASKMMHELAIEIVKHNHTVTVITPEKEINDKFVIEYIDDVRICRFKSGNVKTKNKVIRAVNELLLSTRAWKSLYKELADDRHDLIIYYSPSIFWGSLVKKLKNMWECRSYLVLRDIFPQWVIDQGVIKEKSLIATFFRIFEKINYNAADIIGLQSPKNLEWFNQSHSNRRAELLYNWTRNRKPMNPSNQYRIQLNLDNKIVFFYGGNIGHAQDMMNIVRLADKLKNEKEVHFVLVGDGDEVGLLKKAIIENNLSNITYLPPVDTNQYKAMLAEFDIGLFSLHSSHKTHNFPGKLLDYMNEEKPILGSINPGNDIKQIFESYNAGYLSYNGDDQSFFINAKKLAHDKIARENMGKNSKKLLKDVFSVESAVKQIINIKTL